jgi:hypothetical protein
MKTYGMMMNTTMNYYFPLHKLFHFQIYTHQKECCTTKIQRIVTGKNKINKPIFYV